MNEWVKAWRPRPGSAFEARVSPLAKDWFRGVLVHFNDEGVKHLPKSKTPHGALGMALGYPKGQRRTIAPLMAECLEHGCLVAEQDEAGFWTLTAPNWAPFQEKKRGDKSKVPAAPPSEVTSGSSTSPRTRQVPAAYPESKMGTHRGTRKNAKSPESHKSRSTEKRREEEEKSVARGREAHTPASPDRPRGNPAPTPNLREPFAVPANEHQVWHLIGDAMDEAGWEWFAMQSGLDRQRCTELFQRLGPERLADDTRAWAKHLATLDRPPGKPFLAYLDNAGNWAARAKPKRTGPAPKTLSEIAAGYRRQGLNDIADELEARSA